MKKKQLNREDFVNAMQAYSGETKWRLDKYMDIFLDTIMIEVSKGNKVNLQGFGSFEAVDRAERNVKTPNGEEYVIEAHKTPKFVVGAEFKRRVKE